MNDKTKLHHIHGNIREEKSIARSNMVLGVNERNEQSIDFIYFVKYFQRIQKHVGTMYKKFLKKCDYNRRIATKEDYEVHIYGHSLDETDEDILNSDEFDTIISILNEDAYKVMPVDRGIDYITAIRT